MRRKDHRCSGVGHLVQLVHEDRAFAAEALDHVFVMDDLVAHIDRRAVADERLLDGIDGPHHPGAEAARGAEQDVEGGQGHL